MEQLPSELMINIITQVIRQRHPPHNHHHHRNNKSNKHFIKKKQAAEAYLQWATLRLVCKRWYSLASLCVVYPKYERKKLVYLAKIAEEANQYEGILLGMNVMFMFVIHRTGVNFAIIIVCSFHILVFSNTWGYFK